MDFREYFPIYDKLTARQQATIEAAVVHRSVPKGTVVHNGSVECTGLLLVRSGQLRSYILSDEGREITLYRLFDRLCKDHSEISCFALCVLYSADR